MRLSAPSALLLALLVVASGCLGGSRTHGETPAPTDERHSTSDSLRAEFDFLPRTATAGDPIQFHDRSEGEVVSRAWDFGDATGSTDEDPSHAYAEPGVYRVTLRIKDAQGNEADVLHLVPVSRLGGEGNGTVDGTNPASHPAPVFEKPVTVRNSGGGEPSLAIDKNGHYWVSPPGSLYKSTDGKTFASISYPRVVSGDSHVVADRDGRVWISDLQGFGLGVAPVALLGPSSVWTTTDGGASWTTGNPAASMTVFNDRQWLAVTKGGTGYLLYRSCTVYAVVGCYSLGSLLAETADGGRAWTLTTHTFEWTSYPFANAEDGTLYVVQSEGAAISVSVSTDGAGSFTKKTVAQRRTSTDESFVNGAVDDAGNAYIAWSDADRGQRDIYMAFSSDRGQSWKGPFLVSSSVGTHVFPWIAAGGDGKVVVAWYGSDAKGDPNGLEASAKWYVNVAQSLNAHDARPVFSQARASPEPNHIGPICMNGLGCGESDRDLLDFFTVQVAPDGRAAIAYSADGATTTTKALFALQSGGPRSR